MKEENRFSRDQRQARTPPAPAWAPRGIVRSLLAPFRSARTRRLAEKALAYSLLDLEIDWPVRLVWEKELSGLGQVDSSRKHEIQLRRGQEGEEGVRTTFHEVYHLAQFHKWKSLSHKRGANDPGELERAETLAELYARVTFRELWRSQRKRWWASFVPGLRRPLGRLLPLPRSAHRPRGGPGPLPAYVPWSRWRSLSRAQERAILCSVEWKRRTAP